MSEQMAVMKDVRFGLRDVGVPVLSFSTYITECSAALQIIDDYEGIKRVFIDGNATETKNLEGKPCWVDVDGSRIQFLRVWEKS